MIQRKDHRFAVVSTLPALLIVFFICLFPFVYSFWLSLCKTDLFKGTTTFAGLRNYISAITDLALLRYLGLTIYFVISSTVIGLAMSLLTAIVLNWKFVFRGFVRSVFILPWTITPVVVGIMWKWVFNAQFGALNAVLNRIGLPTIGWFGNGFIALNILVLTFTWWNSPLGMVMILGILQSLPKEIYEAARVDGANASKSFRYLTLPMIRPMLVVVILFNIAASFLMFDLIFVMTGGEPYRSTWLLSWHAFQTVFRLSKTGEGIAIFYLISLITLGMSFLAMKISKEKF